MKNCILAVFLCSCAGVNLAGALADAHKFYQAAADAQASVCAADVFDAKQCAAATKALHEAAIALDAAQKAYDEAVQH